MKKKTKKELEVENAKLKQNVQFWMNMFIALKDAASSEIARLGNEVEELNPTSYYAHFSQKGGTPGCD